MRLKIVYMGSPEFAVTPLESLAAHFDIPAIITQKNKPKGRGRKSLPTPVKIAGEKLGIPILEPTTLRDADFLSALRFLKPDAIVVAAFGKILPKSILDLPRLGCVNLHASLLPKYRGASPIPAAILAGDNETGVCTILMDEHMDTGDVLLSETARITKDDTAMTLHDKLLEPGARLVVDTLLGLEKGTINPSPQDESRATYTKLITKSDGNISWENHASYIERLVRAMIPWPVSFFELEGEHVKIWKSQDCEGSNKPGHIFDLTAEGILVGTGEELLLIKEVQAPGKRRMSALDFARGRHLKLGMKLN